MKPCPICLSTDVQLSHRRGMLERRILGWVRLFPFRCGQCQTRFHRFALSDPRRYGSVADAPVREVRIPDERRRAPRWATHVPAVVSIYAPHQPNESHQGFAENASLEGVRLRLPVALPEGSRVSVSLEGIPSRLGLVCWSQPHEDSGHLHGIRFDAPVQKRDGYSWPLVRIRLRRLTRRLLIVGIALGIIVLISLGLVVFMEAVRGYRPAYYEPKDIEREMYERRRPAN